MKISQRTTRRRKSRRVAVTQKPDDGGAVLLSPPTAHTLAPPSSATSDLSRAEVKELLRAMGIEFNGRSSTADLRELLEAAGDGDSRR